FMITRAVLDTLGIGLEPVHSYMYRAMPTLEELERWVLDELGGALDPARVVRANAIADGSPPDEARLELLGRIDKVPPVLSADDLRSWERDGYVIVRGAVSPEVCRRLEKAIWGYLGADPDHPDSWYRLELPQGVMVPVFRAPGIEEIHASPRIHKAFAQLAGTADLVMTADRCGFNPPIRDITEFRGPKLHLDLDSFDPPVVPYLQGILYLTETSADQGAFRCVPGFHHRIDAWLRELPTGANPSVQDLEVLGPQPVAGQAGDLIIWSSALPHGPGPNFAQRPRIVHYLTMYPTPAPA
ncbi:MAG: hypothetical protein QOF83_2812, partial [Solirubrobacteraceae bacterium]|nr:hypothetical protein [Solirubrobacteraceae bacterium]